MCFRFPNAPNLVEKEERSAVVVTLRPIGTSKCSDTDSLEQDGCFYFGFLLDLLDRIRKGVFRGRLHVIELSPLAREFQEVLDLVFEVFNSKDARDNIKCLVEREEEPGEHINYLEHPDEDSKREPEPPESDETCQPETRDCPHLIVVGYRHGTKID